VTVKDTPRYAANGGWRCYNRNHAEPKAATAKVKDEVWTQFCPRLDLWPRGRKSLIIDIGAHARPARCSPSNLHERHEATDIVFALYGGMTALDLVGDRRDLSKVSPDPTQRLGLLTQGGMMAGTTTSNNTNPVLRGAFVARQLLCRPLALPTDPVSVAQLVRAPPLLSARRRLQPCGAWEDYTWYSPMHLCLLQAMDQVDMGGHTPLDESVVLFGSELQDAVTR
jgi:hypothetical protein